MPKIELSAEVLSVEEREYQGKTYRNAIVKADGKILELSVADGVDVSEGKQVLELGLLTFGGNIRPVLRVVG